LVVANFIGRRLNAADNLAMKWLNGFELRGELRAMEVKKKYVVVSKMIKDNDKNDFNLNVEKL